MRDAGRIASVFADRTKSTDFLTILSVAIQRVDNRAEMVSHPTFQESWGMLVDMNFKVGDQLLRRVPKCLGRSSFGYTFRDFEISLVQLAEEGVDVSIRPGNSSAGGGSPGAVRFLFNLHPLIRVYKFSLKWFGLGLGAGLLGGW